MKHILIWTLFFASACGAESVRSKSTASPEIVRTIERHWLEARAEVGQRTPAALLVFDSQRETPLISSKIDNFDLSHPIHVASASKWISAAVILRLVDSGKMRLDEVVRDYFPSLDISPSVRKISLHELLSFRSGLKNTTRYRNPCRKQESLQRCAKELLITNSSTNGNHDFEYGNVHFVIAGAMAEKATGISWSELYQRELVAPLQLQHSTYYSAGIWKRAATVPLVAGGLVISTSDYLTFLRTIAHNGRVKQKQWLRPDTVKKMLTSHFMTNTHTTHSPFLRIGKHYQYGYGNWVECLNNNCTNPRNSSPGRYGFYPWVDTRHNKFGVLAMESSLLDIKASLKSAQVLDQLWDLFQQISLTKSET
jgi:CubicO group peptidase (beta-lactamase class C family)